MARPAAAIGVAAGMLVAGMCSCFALAWHPLVFVSLLMIALVALFLLFFVPRWCHMRFSTLLHGATLAHAVAGPIFAALPLACAVWLLHGATMVIAFAGPPLAAWHSSAPNGCCRSPVAAAYLSTSGLMNSRAVGQSAPWHS